MSINIDIFEDFYKWTLIPKSKRQYCPINCDYRDSYPEPNEEYPYIDTHFYKYLTNPRTYKIIYREPLEHPYAKYISKHRNEYSQFKKSKI